MKHVKRYRYFLILLGGLLVLSVFLPKVGLNALSRAGDSTFDMLSLLPPILVLAGLLDQWVSKDLLMKYMGKGSGIVGLALALLLGFVSAGALYVAFPIAIVLIKKGAAVRNVVFFLGVWTTAKLPVVLYELTSFGAGFTALHVGFGLAFYLLLGVLFERIFDQRELLKHDITEEAK